MSDIGPARCRRMAARPCPAFGVSHTPVDGAPDWWTTSTVCTQSPDLVRHTRCRFGDVEREFPGSVLDRGKNTSRRRETGFRVPGRRDGSGRVERSQPRNRARLQERQRAKMSRPVQMAPDNAVDGVELDLSRLQRDESRRPAVEQDTCGPAPVSIRNSVEAAARAERVTGAEMRQPHVRRFHARPCRDLVVPALRGGSSVSGTASLAGFRKSIEISPVMSATE